MENHSSFPSSTNTSVTRQLQLVFSISIIILLISSYASFYSNKQLIDTSKLVNHTNEIIIHSENMMSLVKDAETGQRGFLLTDDAAFLQSYNGALSKVTKEVDYIKSLTRDNPLQQQNIEKARLLINERFRQLQIVIASSTNVSITQRAELFVTSHEHLIKGKLIMDQLRAVVNDIRNEENKLLEARTHKQDMYINYTPILVVIAALVSILISILAYLRIKADLDARLEKQRQDEAKYIETNQRISKIEGVARQIAGGNYSVRSNDDRGDDLGRIAIALNEMVAALETNFKELEKRNWLQTGTVNLSNNVRGERQVQNVSSKLLNSIGEHIGALVGTVYLADSNYNLKLVGGYATQSAPVEIAPGQGLLGEALKNKKITVINDLPPNYMQIASSTGKTDATSLIICPFVYDDQVIGAMELGMVHKPDSVDIEFLQNNLEAISITLNAAINYERMQELLEETQAQAEELQAQQNELENINTELEAQTQKLQASEEELRVQQEELQQTNEELEERTRLLEERNQQIADRNIEVQKKAEELALSTKYKSEFLANMSHELRTPLNSILLLSRLMSENSEKNLTDDQVEYAKVIQSSGQGLLALIDEILDLSKIEAGKMELEYENVPVSDIVSDMKGIFEPVAKEKKLQFNLVVEKDVPGTIETDKLRLEQIIKNLISNSLKFTSKGSVSLNITKEKNGQICFAVKDTGIGIPKEKQRLIFEAFQQADGSTRRKFGGTGLGLSISRELVKLLGGRIELFSEAEKGSTFTVSIPVSQADKITETVDEVIAEPEIAEVAPVMKKPENDLSQYTVSFIPESIPDDRNSINKDDKIILIIEDDTAFAKSLLDFTRKKGYKGLVSVRGDEGITLANKFMPSGILLDIQLPVKNGWEVMEELKSNAKTRHIPIHIMSSLSAKNKSLNQGAIDFIDKPVAFEQMQEVFKKIEYVLNKDAKKVLIVEENPKHAKALAYFLETFNINSEIKNSVADSVSALKSQADCVILDMGIPDPKAYEMLENIKKNPGMENLPIIIFTGKSLSLSEEQKIKQYADSIVVKTAHSYQRILDEISLFLHLVEEHKTKKGDSNIKKLGALNDVLKDKTVLIVDDDVRNIFSLTKALERMDMHVITAIDGKEALQKLEEHKKVDVVLLDMMMPEMDGYETATRIRKNQRWKNLPVIAVTAKAMTGDREKCIRAGASDYITKPVDVDQLLSLLRVWLYERV